METYSLPSRFFVSEKPFVRATQARTLFSIGEIKRTHSQQSRVSTVHTNNAYNSLTMLFFRFLDTAAAFHMSVDGSGRVAIVANKVKSMNGPIAGSDTMGTYTVYATYKGE